MRVASNAVRLSARFVDELPFAASDGCRVEYRDTAQPGLLLRVGKLSKTYYVFVEKRARSEGSKPRVRLGRHPFLSLQEARRQARCALGDSACEPAEADHLGAKVREPLRIDDELLTTEEAAALTRMSVAWFKAMRSTDPHREGPPYLRRGRTIRYVRRELMEWWGQGN